MAHKKPSHPKPTGSKPKTPRPKTPKVDQGRTREQADEIARKAFPIPPGIEPWSQQLGLRVRLSRIDGLTAPEILAYPFTFQCPPLEQFTRNLSFEYSDYMALRLGQFDRPQGYNLQRVQFQTLFVDHDEPWTVLKAFPQRRVQPEDPEIPTSQLPDPFWVPNPRALVTVLRDVMHAGTPVKLEAFHPTDLWTDAPDSDFNEQTGAPISPIYEVRLAACTLRELDIEERAGELDARYVTVTFVESRRPEVLRKASKRKLPLTVTIEKDGWVNIPGVAPQQMKMRVKPGAPPGTYCTAKTTNPANEPDYRPIWCRPDPSLQLIAKLVYGSSRKWRLIKEYKKNRKVIPKTFPGDKGVAAIVDRLGNIKSVKLVCPPEPQGKSKH